MSFIIKTLPYVGAALVGAFLLYLIKPDFAKKVEEVAEQAKEKIEKIITEPVKSEEEKNEVIIVEKDEPEKFYCLPMEPTICPPVKSVSCPSIKPTSCPAIPECKPKVVKRWYPVYRDKKVAASTKLKPGCHVDWETGNVTASTTPDKSLRCTVDHLNKHVDTKFWASGVDYYTGGQFKRKEAPQAKGRP